MEDTKILEKLDNINRTVLSFYGASNDQVKTNKELAKKLDEHVQILRDYIKDDLAWKRTAQPAIDLGNSARNASKAGLWLGGAIIVIGGAAEIIIRFFTKKISL